MIIDLHILINHDLVQFSHDGDCGDNDSDNDDDDEEDDNGDDNDDVKDFMDDLE